MSREIVRYRRNHEFVVSRVILVCDEVEIAVVVLHFISHTGLSRPQTPDGKELGIFPLGISSRSFLGLLYTHYAPCAIHDHSISDCGTNTIFRMKSASTCMLELQPLLCLQDPSHEVVSVLPTL
jgi:hypothetical protein